MLNFGSCSLRGPRFITTEVVMPPVALNNPHTTALHMKRKTPHRLFYSSFIFLVQVATG